MVMPILPKRTSILLALAFTCLLAVVGAAALAIWFGARSAQKEVSALHKSHLEAGDALASIRANVFLAGILTRDYLLDSDPSHSAQYSSQFDNIRQATDANFRTLAASGPSGEERLALDKLRTEVGGYWDHTMSALAWTPAQKQERRPEFLQDRVRLRQEIVELAAQVERLLTSNFSAERSRLTTADERFEASLAWTTGIALLLALIIAAATVARMIALERQAASTELELRRLSGQIRMAQEQERRLLSRELHDQAGQMLTGLRMELTSISRDASPEELSTRIAHARGIVEQTLRIIRNIAMLLRPSMLDDLGLSSALGWLIREVSRTAPMEIHADIDPAVDSLPDAHRTCAYRVVQEALTNATRHSAGHKIYISLKAESSGISGIVADDGHGFHVSSATNHGATFEGKGLGLIGMEERVRELGGKLRVASQLGSGTRVEFRLPWPSASDMLSSGELAAAGVGDS